jgi:NAD(P)H dehydrogenase (quinone)
MKPIISLLISVLILLPLASLGAPQNDVPIGPPQQAGVKVLVIYHSQTGNTEKMAKSVVLGAQKIAGVTSLAKKIADVTYDDLKSSDAILLGSPTYYGDMAGPMKSFIDDWFFKYRANLVDKVGGAFSSGLGDSGGKEHVLYSLIIAMMNAGMIIAGPIVEGTMGTAGVAALDPVNETALKECQALGEHVASIARRVKSNGAKF